MRRKRGMGTLGVSAFPTFRPSAARSPLAIFPPPSLYTLGPASLNPTPFPALFLPAPVPPRPSQCSTGSDKAPRTDLKGPGATIRGSDTTQGPTAAKEGGYPDWCPHLRPGGHVSDVTSAPLRPLAGVCLPHAAFLRQVAPPPLWALLSFTSS